MTTSEIQYRWHQIYSHLRSRCACTHDEAEDLTQELFARLLRRGVLDNIANRDSTRDDVRNYLFAVARNLFREQLRRSSTWKRGGRTSQLSIHDEANPIDPPADVSDPSAAAEQCEVLRNWHRELAALSQEASRAGKQRLFVRLKDALSPGGEPVDTRATAAALGVSAISVRVQLHRWRKQLIDRVQEGFEPARAA